MLQCAGTAVSVIPCQVKLCHQSSSTTRFAPGDETSRPGPTEQKTDVGEAFEDTANGRVIKMIVMIMGDDDRIKLMKLIDRQ
jgi:hypothetical protein